jgi:hypothetical protein
MTISRRGLLGTAAVFSYLPRARAEVATIKVGQMNGGMIRARMSREPGSG